MKGGILVTTPAPFDPMLWANYKPVVDAIAGPNGFDPVKLIAILGSIFGAAIAFVIVWFIVKRVVKILMGAITGGKLASGASSKKGWGK